LLSRRPRAATLRLFFRITVVENEGLRLGLFFGGLIMAAIPVILGVAAVIFLFKKYREERELAD
jgi:hypothetical protein